MVAKKPSPVRPTLFAIKGSFDALAGRVSFFPRDLSDKIIQAISRLFPQHLPKRMKEYRDKYEHHLMLKMAGTGIADTRRFLKSIFAYFPEVGIATLRVAGT